MEVKISMIVCAAAVLAGCRYHEMGTSAAERERHALLSEYETERSKVMSGEEYGSSTLGDYERYGSLFDLSTRMYSKASTWQKKYSRTAEEKALVGELNKFLALWMINIDKSYQNESGSYAKVLRLQDRMIFYDKGICRLLMSSDEKRRWRRVENTEWRLRGKLVKFSKGAACASLTWRLFGASSYLKDYGWQMFIEEKSVVSANGVDYAIVRFAGKDNLTGCPTTTEERVLVEIKEGRITRYVGLHNIIGAMLFLANGRDQIVITAETGYFKSVKYVIGTKKMKIIKSKSVLPDDFTADGYDKLFVE